MKGKLRWLKVLLAAALTVILGGCYTVVSRTTPPGQVTQQEERITVTERTPAEDENAQGDEEYYEYEDDRDSYDTYEQGAGDEYEYTESEDSEFGLRAEKYIQQEGDQYAEAGEGDGETIINNYYGYPGPDYNPAWYRSWYSRYWYDPWDWSVRPAWRSSFYVGIVYDPWDPFYWHDPWAWGFGIGWYDPWHWHEPWYWGGGWGYAYYPRYSPYWYGGYYDHDNWHDHDGGGHVADGPRKSRPDRLSGFGSGRRTGDTVSSGDTAGKSASSTGESRQSVRRGSRDSNGTTTVRRNSSGETSKKTTGSSSKTRSSTTTKRRNSTSGKTSGNIRYQINDRSDGRIQRKISSGSSGSSTRRTSGSRLDIQRITRNGVSYRLDDGFLNRSTQSSGTENASVDTKKTESGGETKTTSRSERVKSSNTSSGQSGQSSRVSRPSSSGSSRTSYSRPSGGGSRSGSSGGGSSRSSGSKRR